MRAAVLHQEQVVDGLAAEIARARQEHANRTRMSELMAQYRAEAEALAALETPRLRAAADAEAASRIDAERRLSSAVATGSVDEASRSLLVGWLGSPEDRVATLTEAYPMAMSAADPSVRHALLLDIAEQCGVIALVSAYDSASALRDAERARVQADALRARTAPGQSGGLDLMVAAERLEREASADTQRATLAQSTHDRAERLRAGALTVLSESP